jgi:hypothetical protein
MRSTLRLLALSASALLISISAFAQTPESSTLRLTEPLDVGGTIVQPGDYTIRVLPSFANRDQIQVTSPDLKTVYATALSVPHYLQVNELPANTTFVYYPAGDGQPQALRTWYAPDAQASQGGHDIVYKKARAAQLARLSHSRVVSYEDQTAVADLGTAPLLVVTPEAKVETYTPAPVTTVTTPMTSAATTPAEPATTQVAEAAPAEMPHTAGNTPLLALFGLGAIGAAIVLRRTF